MGSRKDLFYKDLIIDEEDKPLAERYLASKGVEKHIILKEKLFNWIEGDKIKYSMIASTYRYDKRLRLILFKYISYLEEFYRAVILDKYRNNPSETEWIKDIADNLRKFNGDLNDALEQIGFSALLSQIRHLPRQLQEKCNIPAHHARVNCFAIKTLRNAVMHNKFLLLYRGFSICYVNGVDGGKVQV